MRDALAREGPRWLQKLLSCATRSSVEIALAGLDGSGKSTLAHALDVDSGPRPPVTTVPTIGLVVQRVMHSGIEVSVWDLGGRQKYRSEWGRHVSGCSAVAFVLDVSDPDRVPEARQALHQLLDDPRLRGMPLLVVASKFDMLHPTDRAELERLRWAPLASHLNLDCVTEHEWTVLGVSAKEQINLDKLTRWIVLQAHSGRSTQTGADLTRRGVALWRLTLMRIGTWFTGERPRPETEFTLLGAAVDTPL
jgi:GTPase SAR1 family protein